MIRWNDNYITGIEKLDKEHQQLFQMADQVLNKLRERGDEANRPGNFDLYNQLF